jgi:hypothetical protein
MSQSLDPTARAIIQTDSAAWARTSLSKDLPVQKRRLSTLSIWLGLFAMLMIHVGPLYSALQTTPAAATSMDVHEHHAGHDEHSPSAQGHHKQPTAEQPAWLTALEMCGYCELLTLNPPLALSLDLALPRHEPEHFQPLPATPLSRTLRRSSGYARAPPLSHC